MKILFKNGQVVNVFTGVLETKNVLVEDEKIIGVDDYSDSEADQVIDCTNKVLCPGFIDSHIHIESTMLTPKELSRICVPHGTTAIVADPHEIANVSGVNGINYMLEASKDLPMSVYFMIPSCVPASPFDEAGTIMSSSDIRPFYEVNRVLGLAEMMNYPGVINKDPEVIAKIEDAHRANKIINGHAPMLRGKDLDSYISAGIWDDHECSTSKEAKERISKGQAKNLKGLLDLFESPWSQRCMLATDDKHPADLISNGHIDSIIREAVTLGKSVITGIQMATIQPANFYGIWDLGAIAPGYKANILVLNDLDTIDIKDVYKNGKLVATNGKAKEIIEPEVDEEMKKIVHNTHNLNENTTKDFEIPGLKDKCRVIRIIPGEILTDSIEVDIDSSINSGINVSNDILKIAVIERHNGTGHIGLGFINGLGLKSGAIASSVSHDSHNLIVIGTNDSDMAIVANHIRNIGGGLAIVNNGEVIADLPLPVAGLMNEMDAAKVSTMNENLRTKTKELGINPNVDPFMNMAFVSLPVIPHLKITTKGLVDVDEFKLVDLKV